MDSEGKLRPALRELHTGHPILSLTDSNVVYIMGKVNRWDKKVLVLSIDMRFRRLLEVVRFDAHRMVGVVFGHTYIQSRISKYIDMNPVVYGNPKRPGEFHMWYPRKLQDTGARKGAKDADNRMALN
ncbi:hypothetical protein ACP70R_010484 [Stipagrostis hirtigluma subsp. patula]